MSLPLITTNLQHITLPLRPQNPPLRTPPTPKTPPALPPVQASKYLADQTLDAIGEMFVSARAIMGWLADCARVVAADGGPVTWTSPLGLPILQPYQKLSMTNVTTTTQTFHVSTQGGARGGGAGVEQRCVCIGVREGGGV